MIREVVDCIDVGSEFCPCNLAEMGECILCSQMQGKYLCDCLNWKGVCIYQEFLNNGMKAKEGRKRYSSKIVNYYNFNDEFVLVKLSVTHKLAVDLINPGGYVFLCPDSEKYFDIPISVMESDTENDILTVAVSIKGLKTKKLLELKTCDTLDIRGPYWNGIFGLKNIEKQKGTDCLILARGIGIAPSIPLIRKLSLNECNIDMVVDNGDFKEKLFKEYLGNYKMNVEEGILLENGELSAFCKKVIDKSINSGTKYIHISGADILTFKVIRYLDSLGKKEVLLSCCNNFKICCGEGICGACTAKDNKFKVKRYCKVQTEPRGIFEEGVII